MYLQACNMLHRLSKQLHGTAITRTVMRSDDSSLVANLYNSGSLRQLLWPWCATVRLCATSTANTDAPLIVSAEAAHVAARRHINLVNIPDYLASPPVEQVKGVLDLFPPCISIHLRKKPSGPWAFRSHVTGLLEDQGC